MQQPSEMACYWTKIPMAGDRFIPVFRNTNFSWYASNEGEREQWIDTIISNREIFLGGHPFPVVLIWIHGPSSQQALTLRHGDYLVTSKTRITLSFHICTTYMRIRSYNRNIPQLYIYKLPSWQCHLSSFSGAQWRSNFPLVSPCCAVSLGCVEGCWTNNPTTQLKLYTSFHKVLLRSLFVDIRG